MNPACVLLFFLQFVYFILFLASFSIISVSWRCFIGVWVIADFRKPPELFPANLINAVIWMVSVRPPISNPSSPLFKLLGTVPSASITTGITVTLMFHCFFSSLARSKYLSLFSFSLILTLRSAGMTKPSIRKTLFFSFLHFFFFFLNYPSVWFSGRDYEIRLYLKIPENFMRLILQDGFWFVQIPFGCMVKYQFLAQFSADNLSYPVMSSLILPSR